MTPEQIAQRDANKSATGFTPDNAFNSAAERQRYQAELNRLRNQ